MPSSKDLQYTLRTVRKSPGFTLVVILTMALGIGANTAVFSIVYAVLLRPLPFPDSAHILNLCETKIPYDYENLAGVAPANFLDWQEKNRSFDEIAASVEFNYNLTGKGSPEQVVGNAISTDWFKVLRVQPELGRVFLPEEDRSSAAPVVLLSDRLWRRRFSADPGIVGKTIGINGDGFMVVGVMPPGADYNEQRGNVQLWIPVEKQIRPDRMMWRDARFLNVIGRLKSGISIKQGSDDLNRIAAQIREAHSGLDIYGAVTILPLQRALNGDQQHTLFVSLGIVALVLLVACANVANLMLVRVTGRSRELAVRLALGATPGRLMKQLATEGICLGLLSGLLGIAFAIGGKKFLLFLLPWQAPEVSKIELSVPALLFTLALSVLTGMVFGMVPGMLSVRRKLQFQLLRVSGTATGDRSGRIVRHGLAVVEIACSLVLLAGAGLLVRSFYALQHVMLGFSTDHRVSVRIALPRIKYQTDANVVNFFEQVSRKVRDLPGVEDAAIGFPLPLDGGNFASTFKIISEKQLPDQYNEAELRLIDSHYFSTMGVPLLQGRNFSDADKGSTEPVCVISQAMARRYWQGRQAVGQLLVVTRSDVNGAQPPRRVIGIVGDVRHRINVEPEPTIYVPYEQMSFFTLTMAVHSQHSVASVAKSVSAAVQTVDPDQPLRSAGPMDGGVPESLAPWNVALILLGGLAGLAVLLTAMGIFAVMSYLVREKTREIGIRIAIGASPGNVRNMVLLQTAKLAAIGITIGLLLAEGCTRLLGQLIYGVKPNDPLTFAIVAMALGGLAVLASYLPARHATRVDPIIALRCE